MKVRVKGPRRHHWNPEMTKYIGQVIEVTFNGGEYRGPKGESFHASGEGWVWQEEDLEFWVWQEEDLEFIEEEEMTEREAVEEALRLVALAIEKGTSPMGQEQDCILCKSFLSEFGNCSLCPLSKGENFCLEYRNAKGTRKTALLYEGKARLEDWLEAHKKPERRNVTGECSVDLRYVPDEDYGIIDIIHEGNLIALGYGNGPIVRKKWEGIYSIEYADGITGGYYFGKLPFRIFKEER